MSIFGFFFFFLHFLSLRWCCPNDTDGWIHQRELLMLFAVVVVTATACSPPIHLCPLTSDNQQFVSSDFLHPSIPTSWSSFFFFCSVRNKKKKWKEIMLVLQIAFFFLCHLLFFWMFKWAKRGKRRKKKRSEMNDDA